MSTKRARSESPVLLPTASTSAAQAIRHYPWAGPTQSPKTQRGQPGYGEPQERRLKVYKRDVPKKTQDRADRVMTQRFFCVGRDRTSPVSEEFKVLGSTGNVYTCCIAHVPTCDCPDGQKGNHCKHLIFVLLKILQVPVLESNLWYQSALLTSELEAIFANARPAPRTLLEERVQRMYRLATGEVEAEGKAEVEGSQTVTQKRIPQEGDSCPICYEDFEPGSEQGLVFCLSIKGCGNALHKPCFGNWALTVNPVTCPLCREKWHVTPSGTGSSSQAGPSYSSEGYLNLAAQAGLSAVRDTSSYYSGPRRGEKGRQWNRRDRYGGAYDDDDYTCDYDGGF
ncbi:uncharacterized protein JCM15063_005074 [Sporobolomyces koalae]|uniref:uncharacterized protein n=1 Tax=Sporobolomyces koalae TaxID=500713 RepID=UPI00317E1487